MNCSFCGIFVEEGYQQGELTLCLDCLEADVGTEVGIECSDDSGDIDGNKLAVRICDTIDSLCNEAVESGDPDLIKCALKEVQSFRDLVRKKRLEKKS